MYDNNGPKDCKGHSTSNILESSSHLLPDIWSIEVYVLEVKNMGFGVRWA